MPAKPKNAITLPAALARALNGQTPATDSGTLLKFIMQRWGGPEALANDLYSEFRKAPEGSMFRKSIFELIQRLVIQNTEAGIEKAVRPADLDDVALDGMVMHYMARLNTPLEAASYGTHSHESRVTSCEPETPHSDQPAHDPQLVTRDGSEPVAAPNPTTTPPWEDS